jgi:hypothetical protein
MANSYFEVDTGVKTGGVVITSANNEIRTTGNIVTTGNITLNTSQISYTANSVTPKSYVDNIAVVFGV